MSAKSKRTVLIKVSYLLNLEEKDEELLNLLDKISRNISYDQNIEIDNEIKNIKWIETSKLELNPNNMNCGKCYNCETWTTDREKPNPIMELCNGATIDGKLLCDECLPEDHRWAF
ncbi:hypothetical protein [Paenibacillus sp. SI8]|uniref:hypothetical protein n=1 Tax=unclassified Paenibacillus TaxID=185978 RepID=UPI003466562D